MSPFRCFIVGLSKAFLVFFIIAGTVVGALLGWKFMQFASTSSYLGALQAYLGLQAIQIIGAIVGAVSGFLVPAWAASLLYMLAEIQKTSQETAGFLKFIANGVPPSAPEP